MGGIEMPNPISRNNAVVLPSNLYSVDSADAKIQQISGSLSFFNGPIEALGIALRNAFYLPLYKKNIDIELQRDQTLAKEVWDKLQNPQARCSKELQEIKDHFSIRDINVHLQGSVVRIFTVRLFESKVPLEGKRLRVILFCFSGNTEYTKEAKTKIRAWNPLTLGQLSQSPLAVMRVFQKCGIEFDSLITNSLGNVTLDEFKNLPSRTISADNIPSTLIINRGFTSTFKVASRLFTYVLSCILHKIAKLCGWDANPEEGLLYFLEKHPKGPDGSPRKIVLIEALEDHYFSGEGAPEADLHEKITRTGASIFRGKFWPFPFHVRSHHAIPVNHFKYNSVTQIEANSMSFSLDEEESISSAIARNVFFAGREEFHTSFCIGGADATLNSGTVRDVIPLLSAFIEKGIADAEMRDRLTRAV